jgi:hypothetical protein
VSDRYDATKTRAEEPIQYLDGSPALAQCILPIPRIRYRRQRRTLEQLLEGYQADLALVRYVMLNRRCSEEAAYQRIAIFIKQHVPLDDQSYVDKMLARDRQSLLEKTRGILLDDSNGIEKI